MDRAFFKAAEAGDIGPFKNSKICLDQLLTPDESTILHIYLRSNQSSEGNYFVDTILQSCPKLLLQANKKGEIPLHLAARYGQSEMVEVLINRAKDRPTDPESRVTEAKKMLRMANEEQDTALHEAARNSQSQVVEILTEGDPEFSYSANVHGETPLYIAAASGRGQDREKVIEKILNNCTSVDYGGPNGRTALHAAIRVGDHGTARKLLEKAQKLTKTTDENGWSPLHYAAYFKGTNRIVQVLLEFDASAACIAETEKKRTALHIAAIQGHVNAMKEIVSRCPDCCELVDNKGWNALHYAVASNDIEAFEQCLEIPELARLGTEKDHKRNTPFHLIAALAHEKKNWRRVLYKYCRVRETIHGLNMQQQSVDDIYEGSFADKQKEILESLKDAGNGPLGSRVLKIENVERRKELKDALSKVRESQLVVAALIATVTFAAAFTLPGGYINDQGQNKNKGTALLAKKPVFIIFVISDTISLMLSILAVFVHFLIALIKGWEMVKNKEMDGGTTERLFWIATLLTMIGIGTMIIAFITGIYAVLDCFFGLAISTCLIGLSFFILVSLVVRFIRKNLKD